jgi:hypothetical protein
MVAVTLCGNTTYIILTRQEILGEGLDIIMRNNLLSVGNWYFKQENGTATMGMHLCDYVLLHLS